MLRDILAGWRLYLGVVAMALLIVALPVSVALLRASEPAPDPRAGITCMDDAGGGVYCWTGSRLAAIPP